MGSPRGPRRSLPGAGARGAAAPRPPPRPPAGLAPLPSPPHSRGSAPRGAACSPHARTPPRHPHTSTAVSPRVNAATPFISPKPVSHHHPTEAGELGGSRTRVAPPPHLCISPWGLRDTELPPLRTAPLPSLRRRLRIPARAAPSPPLSAPRPGLRRGHGQPATCGQPRAPGAGKGSRGTELPRPAAPRPARPGGFPHPRVPAELFSAQRRRHGEREPGPRAMRCLRGRCRNVMLLAIMGALGARTKKMWRCWRCSRGGHEDAQRASVETG